MVASMHKASQAYTSKNGSDQTALSPASVFINAEQILDRSCNLSHSRRRSLCPWRHALSAWIINQAHSTAN